MKIQLSQAFFSFLKGTNNLSTMSMDIDGNIFLKFPNIDFSFAVSHAIGYHDTNQFAVLQ